MRLGVAMTIEAPTHVQAFDLLDVCHQIDTAMTALTTDSLLHVRGVVEEHEVRQIVYAAPDDGLAFVVAAPHRLELGTVDPNLRMTTHARSGVRHARAGGALGVVVTEETIDPCVANVMAMIELNWLRDRFTLTRVEWTPDPGHQQRGDADDPEDDAHQEEAKQVIEPSGK